MKRHLILSVVALLVLAAVPALASDLDQQAMTVDKAQSDIYGMTTITKSFTDVTPDYLIWFETRWVSNGCCTKSWGLAYYQKEQVRECDEIHGCEPWQDTGATDCTSYPCW